MFGSIPRAHNAIRASAEDVFIYFNLKSLNILLILRNMRLQNFLLFIVFIVFIVFEESEARRGGDSCRPAMARLHLGG